MSNDPVNPLRQYEGVFPKPFLDPELAASVFEDAGYGIIIVDDIGNIFRVNSQAEQLFGYNRRELIGQPVEMLVPKELQTKHVVHRQGYQSAPKVRPMGQNLKLEGVNKAGKRFPLEIRLSPSSTASGTYTVAFIRSEWNDEHA